MKLKIALMSDDVMVYKVLYLKKFFGSGILLTKEMFFPHVCLGEAFCYTEKQKNFIFKEMASLMKNHEDVFCIKDKVIIEDGVMYVIYKKTEQLLNLHLAFVDFVTASGGVVISKYDIFFTPRVRLCVIKNDIKIAKLLELSRVNFSYQSQGLGMFLLDNNNKHILLKRTLN